MDRISSSTKVVDLFGAGKHGFRDGNLALGISPTDFNAAFFNDLQEELLTIIENNGITPTAGTRNQIYLAIQAMIAGAAANDYKVSVRAATTTSINLAAPGAAIDSVAMAVGNRFLDKDNATANLRGIYIWNGAAVAATRATDADGVGELTSGAVVAVEEGTINADSQWMLTTDGAITIGTTALAFARKDVPPGLLSSSGYQKLPSGLIIQWGSVLTNGSGDAQWMYPIAFPSVVYFAVSQLYQVGSTATATIQGTPLATGFSVKSTAPSLNVFCLALGQ